MTDINRTGRKALVVGAGISGLTAAAALGRRGWAVDLIERKARIDDGGGVGLTLVANAMRALDRIGVAGKCVDAGVPADRIVMRNPEGEILLENPLPRIGGPEWPGGTGIVRADFHAILVEAARPVCAMRCGVTVSAWEDRDDGILVSFSDGSTGRYDLAVAAEGLYSATRALLMPDVVPEPTGQAVWRVAIPRPAGIDCTNMFLGGRHGVVGVCPISRDEAYMYIVQADDGLWRDEATLHQQFRAELEGYGGMLGDMAALIDRPEQVSFRPLEWLLAPAPWGRGRLVMIGDAVHANPPVLAQGAAMGIEDAIALSETLAEESDIEAGLAAFVERRYPRVRHVVEASCQLARWEVEGRRDVDVPGVMRETTMRLAEPI